jgi:hypothetical protein
MDGFLLAAMKDGPRNELVGDGVSYNTDQIQFHRFAQPNGKLNLVAL